MKNWKLKMRIALLVPLIFVIVYIVAQSGAIDMSSITGFATLGAKSNDKDNNDKLPAGLSGTIPSENDYSIFAQDKDKNKDKDKDKDYDNDQDSSDNQSNQDENLDDGNNDTQIQAPPVLGGGGSSGGATDDEPVVIPSDDDTVDEDDSEFPHGSTAARPNPPANFWGILRINGTVADAGKTIIATINDTQYPITTVADGYYTVTVPGTGETVDFSYNDTVIETSSGISGAVKELDLYF